MEERTLLFKLLSLKDGLSFAQPLSHEVFTGHLEQHGISLELPLLEALVNVSSRYEAKRQTLWIYPLFFFEGVIQALSGKRSYKAEAGFWPQQFPGEDSIPWQRFAQCFVQRFGEMYDPEEVKRVLLLLRTQAQHTKPLLVCFADFLLFTKTCSLAPVRPSLPPKTRQMSTTKLQYAKLLFFTLESSLKHAYFRVLLTKPASKVSVSAADYRKYQAAKTLQNPIHIVELSEKLESLRVLTERRSAKPSLSSKLEGVRTKVLVRTLDLVWKRTASWRAEQAWERLKSEWEVVKERSRKAAKQLRGVLRAGVKSALQRRFHTWHVLTVSGVAQSRSRSYNALASLSTSRIPKEASEMSISRDCMLNVSGWFLGSYLFNSLSKLYCRRLSQAFQTTKSANLNRISHLERLDRSVKARLQGRALQRWSTAAQRIHLVSRLRQQCSSNLSRLQSRMQRLSAISAFDKLHNAMRSVRLRQLVQSWKSLQRVKRGLGLHSPVRKAKANDQFHTPSKRKPSPHKSPSPSTPKAKSPSPRPRKSKAGREEKVLAPRKKREKSPGEVEELKVSIVRIRLQHACEKMVMVRRMLSRKPLLSSAMELWRTHTSARSSPRFLEAPSHMHNLSFSGDEVLFEDAQPPTKGLSIAELRSAIATLRRTAKLSS